MKIYPFLLSNQLNQNKMAKTKPAAQAAELPEGSPVENNHFVEWEVKVTSKVVGEKTVKEAEKMKISRPCVKISEEEAETLNAGVLEGGNTYAKMYFKPE